MNRGWTVSWPTEEEWLRKSLAGAQERRRLALRETLIYAALMLLGAVVAVLIFDQRTDRFGFGFGMLTWIWFQGWASIAGYRWWLEHRECRAVAARLEYLRQRQNERLG